MKKICTTCKQELEEDRFEQTKVGRLNSCKNCRSKKKYSQRRQKRLDQGLVVHFSLTEAKKLLLEGKKHCPGCKQILNVTEFSTTKVRKGIASHCRSCNRANLKQYNLIPENKQKQHETYKRNVDRQRNSKLLREFGITLEEYKTMLANQNNSCAICGKTTEENKKQLAVDHDHKTGVNRALLCSSCNICIGFIEKNSLDLAKIDCYLKQFTQRINKCHICT